MKVIIPQMSPNSTISFYEIVPIFRKYFTFPTILGRMMISSYDHTQISKIGKRIRLVDMQKVSKTVHTIVKNHLMFGSISIIDRPYTDS